MKITTLEPTCFWVTGLSGAGKTTFGSYLCKVLNDNLNSTVFLDGDELRRIYNQRASDRSTRVEIGFKNFRLCQTLLVQRFNVVLSAIGMYEELYDFSKLNLTKSCLIFLDVPMEELRRRDSKGIYSKVISGDLTDVAGVDLTVDAPPCDLHVPWEPGLDAKATAAHVLMQLAEKNFIFIN